MKISIGSDHAGVELKQQIMQEFATKHEFINVGTNTSDSVDYPDFAEKKFNVPNSNIKSFKKVRRRPVYNIKYCRN